MMAMTTRMMMMMVDDGGTNKKMTITTGPGTAFTTFQVFWKNIYDVDNDVNDGADNEDDDDDDDDDGVGFGTIIKMTITTGSAFTTFQIFWRRRKNSLPNSFQIPGGAKCAACGSLLNKSE